MSKKIKTIIRLIIISSIMSIVFTAGLKLGAPTKINSNANVIVEQEIAEKKVENLQEKEQLLRQSFQDVAKLQVATGTIDMSYNFSNEVPEIGECASSSPFKILRNTLTKRNFTYTSQYQYNFKYDLNHITTRIENDSLNVYVDPAFLMLEDVKENKDQTKIFEETGIFANKLNSQETCAMSKLCESKAYNYLITDTDLQENAMRCLEKTINNLIEKFEIKKVNVIVYKNGTIANNDKFMKINNVVQRATNLN